MKSQTTTNTDTWANPDEDNRTVEQEIRDKIIALRTEADLLEESLERDESDTE